MPDLRDDLADPGEGKAPTAVIKKHSPPSSPPVALRGRRGWGWGHDHMPLALPMPPRRHRPGLGSHEFLPISALKRGLTVRSTHYEHTNDKAAPAQRLSIKRRKWRSPSACPASISAA